MNEVWKDVNGFKGFYQISNLGNVKSLERKVPQGKYGNYRVLKEMQLHPTDNGNGYLIISLRRGNKRKNYYIHRLVAEHFVDNPRALNYVNHKDYNKRNNNAENLEWCTQKENVLYSSSRMRKTHKNWKVSSTNEKYIYMRGGRYRLSISGKIDRTYATLENAVKAREVVLSGGQHFTS